MDLSILPVKVLKHIAHGYNYVLQYDRSIRLWAVTRPGYKKMYYTSAHIHTIPALIFISDLDVNEKINKAA